MIIQLTDKEAVSFLLFCTASFTGSSNSGGSCASSPLEDISLSESK